MKNKLCLLLSLLIVLVASCNDDSNIEEKPKEPKPANYVSDYPNNINVVYFVPKDSKPLTDYHKRLSGVMIHMRDYYKKEMASHGYENSTFGLETDENNPTLVRIVVIKGKLGKNGYPYDGGGAIAIEEINQYFQSNPSEKTSEHSIIFMPSVDGNNGWNAGGVPFYGYGRSCFVLDYENFDMNNWMDGSREGETNWIGGTLHELGHGMNLPHNQHKATDDFLSMMSWGNHKYNFTPEIVRLTKASAAILHNCQLFCKDADKVFYDKIPSHSIQSLKIYSDDTNLYFRSKFTADSDVKAVIAYNDPKTNPNDADYNAISWCTTNIINSDSVSITMPLNGITEEYKQHPFELRIRFVHKNGDFSYKKFKYQYKDGKPDINIDVQEVVKKNRDNWSVIDFSSEETSGEGENNGQVKHAIDGKSSTFWHSQWQGAQPGYPHFFTIDMSKVETVKGFTFLHRSNKYNGRPKDITIETSMDNENWTNQGDYTVGDKSVEQIVKLPQASEFRYFKITIKNSYKESEEEIFFTHLAEVSVY